ncbi:hypothetical protein D3C85_1524160 [compost metagenome]
MNPSEVSVIFLAASPEGSDEPLEKIENVMRSAARTTQSFMLTIAMKVIGISLLVNTLNLQEGFNLD